MRIIVPFVLACACLTAMTWIVIQEITIQDVQMKCNGVGLLIIDGRAYRCEPLPPKTWEESEDFK